MKKTVFFVNKFVDSAGDLLLEFAVGQAGGEIQFETAKPVAKDIAQALIRFRNLDLGPGFEGYEDAFAFPAELHEVIEEGIEEARKWRKSWQRGPRVKMK